MDVSALLDKFLRHLERQRADIVANAERLKDPRVDSGLQEALKSLDEVEERVLKARPRAEQLQKNLADMKARIAEVERAHQPRPADHPSPWAPTGWPLNDAQIADAIAVLLGRARPAVTLKTPSRAQGSDVVDMSSGAWETETRKKSDLWDTDE